MPFSFARPREGHSARPPSAPEPRFYSTDLLPGMQDLLATVADLETHYEIERERIEHGSGSEEINQRALAELEAAHQHRRGLYEQQRVSYRAAEDGGDLGGVSGSFIVALAHIRWAGCSDHITAQTASRMSPQLPEA